MWQIELKALETISKATLFFRYKKNRTIDAPAKTHLFFFTQRPPRLPAINKPNVTGTMRGHGVSKKLLEFVFRIGNRFVFFRVIVRIMNVIIVIWCIIHFITVNIIRVWFYLLVSLVVADYQSNNCKWKNWVSKVFWRRLAFLDVIQESRNCNDLIFISY